jgi:acetoin utilization deacetylase AcuC-like enzyme
LTELGLTAGDFALLTTRARAMVPPGRVIAMLEGGYDLDALATSASATLAALAGAEFSPERPSAGGPGAETVAAVQDLWERLGSPT